MVLWFVDVTVKHDGLIEKIPMFFFFLGGGLFDQNRVSRYPI